jgi:hypothetical protein
VQLVLNSNMHSTRSMAQKWKRPCYALSSDSDSDISTKASIIPLSTQPPSPAVHPCKSNDLHSFRSNKYIKMPNHQVLDPNNLEHVEEAIADICRLARALTTRATDL